MLKIKKEIKFKINGLIDVPRWKNIVCRCGTTIDKKYPLTECMSCKFQEQENSLPKQKFTVDDKEVKEITIVRGSKFEEIIGWTW